MQNVPENSAKTWLPWLHLKTDQRSVMKKTRLNSWEDDFLMKSFPSSTKRKLSIFFQLSLSIFLSFNGVVLSLKCRTLVLKHLHGDRAAAICWKWISVTKVSKYGKSEYSRALNASYTFQPLMSFWSNSIYFWDDFRVQTFDKSLW